MILHEDMENINNIYKEIRKSNSKQRWMVLKYNDDTDAVTLEGSGHDYLSFYNKFTGNDRLYGYVRLDYDECGTSKVKFVFISWAGKHMTVPNKLKLYVYKGHVQKFVKTFTCELYFYEDTELSESKVKDTVREDGYYDFWEDLE